MQMCGDVYVPGAGVRNPDVQSLNGKESEEKTCKGTQKRNKTEKDMRFFKLLLVGKERKGITLRCRNFLFIHKTTYPNGKQVHSIRIERHTHKRCVYPLFCS